MQSADWITPSQAAVLLKCSPQWVRELADKGIIGMQRTPLGRLISRHDVERRAASQDEGEGVAVR